MADLLTLFEPDPPGPVPAAGFNLWFRPDGGTRSTAWRLVSTAPTEGECVVAIGCGNRRGGRWLVLPAGREP